MRRPAGVLLAVGLAAARADDARLPPPSSLRACGGVGGAYAGAWLAPAAHVAAVDWLPADPKLEGASFRAFRGRCVLMPQPPDSFWVDHLSQYERNVRSSPSTCGGAAFSRTFRGRVTNTCRHAARGGGLGGRENPLISRRGTRRTARFLRLLRIFLC